MNRSISKMTGWNTKLSSNAVGLDNVVLLDDYRQSYTIRGNWQSRKILELKSLAEECHRDNSSFDERSALKAREFIESLPFDLELPAIGVEDSGRILLEWFFKPSGDDPTIFSVVFGDENYIFSLMTPNESPCHGALSYSPVSMNLLIVQIKNYFEISSDHARSESR